jgi:LuxR family transcriptional regulator, maltose regulon positive regulatory protein
MALLHHGSVLRALGERERAQVAITEARSIIGSCPDPGILTSRLSTCGPSPRADTSSGDEELTGRERRVLQLLTSDLSERDIGHELYVSHNTVHSHVRSIYRKLGVSSRSGALQRTRELRLLSS